MEFYFSDANLHKDRYLGKLIKESQDGCEFIFIGYYEKYMHKKSFSHRTTFRMFENTVV